MSYLTYDILVTVRLAAQGGRMNDAKDSSKDPLVASHAMADGWLDEKGGFAGCIPLVQVQKSRIAER